MDYKKILKWALISTPLIIGGVIIYNKVKKAKMFGNGEKQTPPNSIKNGSVKDEKGNTYNNTFPLKKGVKNNQYVGMLQSALGVSIDNWFGTNTYNALISQTGLEEIVSLEELNNVIAQIKSQNEMQNSQTQREIVSTLIMDKYKENAYPIIGITGNQFKYNYIVFLTDTVLKEVNFISINGTYLEYDDSSYINYKQGEKIPLSECILYKFDGYIIIDRKVGVNQGLWKAYPQSIDLI